MKIKAEKDQEGKGSQDKKYQKDNSSVLPSAFAKDTEGTLKWIKDIFAEFEDKFNDLPSSLNNLPEKKIIKELRKQKDKIKPLGDFVKGAEGEERYEMFMEALITGNLHLFLEVLRDASLRVNKAWKGPIELILACYDIVTMEKDTFIKLAEAFAEGDDLEKF